MIRYNPNINEGLNSNQVKYRINNNYTNKTSSDSISLIKIIYTSLINYFNLLNIIISILFMITGSYRYILFLSVIVINTLLNMIPKLRLNRFSSSKVSLVNVIRDSKSIFINSNDLVLDDITIYNESNIVKTDSIILDGTVIVDESHLSGKEKYVEKSINDTIYAESKIISGKCTARVDKIGNNNYIYRIINASRKVKKNSYIKYLLDTFVKVLIVLMLIIGVITYIQTKSIDVVTNYIDKLIPIELMIVYPLILILSIIRLNRRNILVRDLSSLESVSSTNTFCFDKTGTLTTGNLVINKVVQLNKRYNYIDILSIIGKNCSDHSDYLSIISKKYNRKVDTKSFKQEYSEDYIKVSINGTKYYLGDPKVLSSNLDISNYNEYKLLLLKSEKTDIALILFNYELKNDIDEVVDMLYTDNKDIKLISGDSESILLSIAKKIGMKHIKCIDMSINNTNMNHQIVEEYNVFCNASPEQKKILINALKNNNHKITFIGDGLNDLLAITTASSSIVFDKYDEVCNKSDFILLDGKTNHIIFIIKDSNRVINSVFNLFTLSLIKVMYIFLMVITYASISERYRFELDIIVNLITVVFSILILCNKYSKPDINFNKILKKSFITAIIFYIISVILLICKVM